MNRKAMAKETLKILEQGYYDVTVKNEAEQKLEKRQIIIKEETPAASPLSISGSLK